MERTERIALLHGLLTRNRYGLSNDRLMQESACSRSTLYRDLSFMRDSLGAPLVHEGDPARIWRYVHRESGAFQLPGVWLSADELYALMLAQEVLQRSGAGLLSQALGPLQPRIHKLLGDKARRLHRLRVLRTQARQGNQTVFRIVTEAVLEGRQLRFIYQARSTQEERERQVSPQRLTHHRHNWYLDAWDSQQNRLRRFALDRIRKPALTEEAAIELPAAQLDTHQAAGYGIFAGPIIATAVIRFTPHAARWIADVHWHPRNASASCPTAAWNSPCLMPTRASC